MPLLIGTLHGGGQQGGGGGGGGGCEKTVLQTIHKLLE